MSKLPLEGLRVLDLSSFLPGPFATQLLADLGATVLKIERPGHGDAMRQISGPMFAATNRGKHSVALDLRDDADRALLLDLAREARVVFDGFRPGVLDRLGVGYEAMRAVRPDVIFVTLTGWGATGPLANDSGHNGNYLSRTGFVALTGEPGEPPSDNTATPVADMAASMYAAVGVLASLQQQESRLLDVPLMAAGLAWTTMRLAEFQAKGASHRDDLLRRPANGVFRTGDGGYVTIAAVEDHFFQGLCQAIERPDLAEREDLRTYAQRFAAFDEIQQAIQERMDKGTREEWTERLREAGVPVAPVLQPSEVPDDPQVRHLGILHTEPVVHTQPPILGLPARHLTHVPELGEHSDAVRASGWAAIERPAGA